MRKTGLDRDMIIALGLISMVISVAILFLGLFLFRIEVSNVNSGLVVGCYSLMTAALWATLLCRNC